MFKRHEIVTRIGKQELHFFVFLWQCTPARDRSGKPTGARLAPRGLVADSPVASRQAAKKNLLLTSSAVSGTM
jgi:hypothetical protein